MEKIVQKDLSKLVRLCQEIAVIHVAYLNRGFSIKEIAGTFARIYFGQFKRALNDEGYVILKRSMATPQRREK